MLPMSESSVEMSFDWVSVSSMADPLNALTLVWGLSGGVSGFSSRLRDLLKTLPKNNNWKWIRSPKGIHSKSRNSRFSPKCFDCLKRLLKQIFIN